MLIATPEYNASVPGALKNALDWASRPYAANVLRHKRVAVIGASTGLFGAVWAQAELRKVLRTMGASVLEAGLSVAGRTFRVHRRRATSRARARRSPFGESSTSSSRSTVERAA